MSQSKSKEDNIHNKLTEIINGDSSKPKIVNEKSNFVVVTYWWGRGVLNRNTARPCGAFYEDNLNIQRISLNQIDNYISLANKKDLVWAQKK